jgi:uncharacterized protein YqeY
MSSSLKNRISEDMKAALKAGDKDRLKVARLLLADIKRVEIDGRQELDEAGTLSVIERALKQRRDSIEQFTKGGRLDLADAERTELTLIETYMPARLSDTELEKLISTAIADTGATSIRDMGRVMAAIKAEAAGRADMAAVGARVKSRLA